MKLLKYVAIGIAGLVLLQLIGWVILMLVAMSADTAFKDVSNDPAFGKFAPVVGTWKSKVPLKLIDVRGQFILIEPNHADGYKEVESLPVGIEVRIEKHMYRQTFETSYLEVVGSLLAGPNADKPLNFDVLLFPDGLVDKVCFEKGSPKIKETTWSVDPTKLGK